LFEIKKEQIIKKLPVQPKGEVEIALTEYRHCDVNSKNPA
jgi:hypothetical protein